MKTKVKNFSIKGFLLLLVATAFFFFIFGAAYYGGVQDFIGNSTVVEGLVDSVQQIDDTYRTITVSFDVEGTRYSGVLVKCEYHATEGETFRVAYLNVQPDRIIPAASLHNHEMLFMCGIIAIVSAMLLGIGYVVINTYRRKV